MKELAVFAFAFLLLGKIRADDLCASGDHKKPNILFVLADDLGFNDMGWNNENVVTPYMNDLAANGIILDRNYVAPVCSPTRGALMSGKYSYKINMQHMVILEDYPECLELEDVTLGQQMKDLGYKTHYLGKWHLGFCKEECLPTSRGFDSFYGFYNGYIDHYSHKIGEGYDFWDNGVAVWSGDYAADMITKRAVDIIADHKAEDPLYMFVSQALVHTPIQVAPGVEPQNTGDAAADDRANYLSMVTHLDDSFRQIVEALKDNGLYENTIIVFSSDNGGEIGAASNYPLRSGKASSFEGGTRVPGMVHSPLQTKTGIKSEETFYVTDWYSTFVNLAGGSTEGLGLDSLNQCDLIMNGGASARTEFVYNLDTVNPQSYGKGGLRMGDYKLVVGYPGLYDGWEGDAEHGLGLTHEVDVYGVNADASRKRRHSYSFDWAAIAAYSAKVTDKFALYNVIEDPEERKDISAENPDILEKMQARLAELFEEVGVLPTYDHVAAAAPSNWNGTWSTGWC